MRSRRSGTIVNLSSVAGQDGQPTCGMYAASKFALEGLSEGLAREVGEFGIAVLIVEPGAFRTNFLGAFVANEKGVPDYYKNTAVDAVLTGACSHAFPYPRINIAERHLECRATRQLKASVRVSAGLGLEPSLSMMLICQVGRRSLES